MDEMTKMEREILEEVAGIRAARPWGAAVGACLEYLGASGYITRAHGLTEKGREALTPPANPTPPPR